MHVCGHILNIWIGSSMLLQTDSEQRQLSAKRASKWNLQRHRGPSTWCKWDPMGCQFRDMGRTSPAPTGGLNQCWKWAETPSWSAHWLDLLQHYTTMKLVSDWRKSLGSSLKVLRTVWLICINIGSALFFATCRKQWMQKSVCRFWGPWGPGSHESGTHLRK